MKVTLQLRAWEVQEIIYVKVINKTWYTVNNGYVAMGMLSALDMKASMKKLEHNIMCVQIKIRRLRPHVSED